MPNHSRQWVDSPFRHWFQRVIAYFFLCSGLFGCFDSLPHEPVTPSTPSEMMPKSQSPSKVSKPTPEPATTPVKEIWQAEPITATTTARFPHLAPFLGQLLLGTNVYHFVLAAIPAHARGSAWQPLILSAFRLELDLDPVAAVYIVDQTLSGVSLFAGDSENERFRPVDIEFSVDPDQSATVRYGWRSAKAYLVIELTSSLGKLELRFMSGGAQPNFTAARALRLRGYLGSQVVSESRSYGSLRGSLGLFRYDHKFAAGVLSYRPFTAKDRLGEMLLLPEADRSDSKPPLIEGYDFLFGDKLADYIFAEYAIGECHYGANAAMQSGRASANIKRSRECYKNLASGTAHFSVQPNDVANGKYPYPLFLYGNRKLPELYIPLRNDVSVPLPTDRSYKFSADRSSTSWTSAAPLTMSSGMVQRVELPARSKGRLNIDIGANEGPAVVVFERLLLANGDSGLVDFVDRSSVFRLESHVLMVKKWPLNLELLAGSYEIKLLRGQDGAFCTLRADIDARREEKLRCPRALPRQDGLDDLGWIAADLATHVDDEFDLYKRVLGVEWLSSPLHGAKMQTPEQQPFLADASVASSLIETSSELGVGVHAFPISAHAAKAWQEAESQRQKGLIDHQLVEEPEHRLVRFVGLMRDKNPSVFIEIGCPAEHLSFEDYQRIVYLIKPDGLRMYGCSLGIQQDELLAWVAELIRATGQRYLITAASSLGLLASDVHFPRIMLVGRQNADSFQARELVAAMFRGAYTLSSGATLAIEPGADGAKREPRGTLSLTIDLRLLASARVWQLIVYTEQGEILRKPLYESDTRVQKIPISIKVPEGAKWLRAEVRGASQQAVTRLLFERGDGMHLASTNFISIDSLMTSF